MTKVNELVLVICMWLLLIFSGLGIFVIFSGLGIFMWSTEGSDKNGGLREKPTYVFDTRTGICFGNIGATWMIVPCTDKVIQATSKILPD